MLNKYIAKFQNGAGTLTDKVRGPYAKPILITLAATVVVMAVAGVTKHIMDGRITYELSPNAKTLIPEVQPQYAPLFDKQGDNTLLYNVGYTPSAEVATTNTYSKFSATFHGDAAKGIEMNDVVNDVSITLKPLFDLKMPVQEDNRVLYQLRGKNAVKVVSLSTAGYKEDVVIESFIDDDLKLEYKLELPGGVEARIESDGSLGFYGADPVLLGEVATGSEKDAELLEKARDSAEKNQLLFKSPAPYVVEYQKNKSSARVWYSLEDDILTIHTINLDKARYPISIDPSIYVNTAQRLMRGNNETNIDFDVTNELIQKGTTTGARFNDWENELALNENRWAAGTTVFGGFVYSVGGARSDDAMYVVPGESQFVVPTGVTSISIKAWGAGGAGGGSSEDRDGGAGGGGGYAAATLTVTPGEVLTVRIGEGGTGGRYSDPNPVTMGDGGAGGGYSAILRGSTELLVAGGGAGGGGANGDDNNATRANGGAGGAGGGTSGVAGSTSGSTTGGGAGTSSAGGAAGASSTSGGTAGSSLQGGTGASEDNKFGTTAQNGGAAGGQGSTGLLTADRFAGGGGAGGGHYGGGGGGRTNADYNGGAGGGGGSGYVTGTSTTNTAGSGVTPGNSADGDRNSAGDGGAGGVFTTAPQQGVDGDNGLVLITISSHAVDATDDVYWAQIDDTTQSIDSPNPGAGVCTGWCNDSAYDLPAVRAGLSLVAYNGFLYAIGGEDASGTRQTTVYIAKIGANGEPSLWHPTDDDKANWDYWYTSTSTLSTATSYGGAVAYKNKIYFLGGQTGAATGGVTTVLAADVKPTGDISAWSSTGMTVLPSARHNHSIEVYNDNMYLLGGNSSGTLQSAVHYIRLDSDGDMTGGWTSTEAIPTARMAGGGDFTAIWGAYIYISGGCTAVNGSDYCTTVEDDAHLASINADGSITKWTEIKDVYNQRFGMGLIAWQNALYGIGGCRAQNATSGDCDWGIASTDIGPINQDGDASTVRNSVLSGTSPCDGVSPTDCNIPPEGTLGGAGGNMSGGAVINNGIIYYAGGCTAVNSGSICFTGNAAKASDNIFYASVADDGRLEQVTTCPGTFYGNWCVENSNDLPSGLAGFGMTVFNNVLYTVGGTTGTAFSSNVYYSVLNSDGSLGAWSTQTFTDLDLGTARGYPYVFTRANPGSASTYPGNMYVLGGCAPSPVTTNGVDCSDTQFTQVYKCNITPSGALETADANDCTTSGQLQIDSEPSTGGSQGLGVMAGAIYANYIYLIGGQSPNEDQRGQVMYAKIDNSNNIVATTGSIWQTSSNELDPVRRRGVAFGYNGYLYAITGYNVGETLNDLLFAKIDVSDGSIDPFVESGVTVLPRWDSQGIVNNGFVFTLGGCSFGLPPQDCTLMNRTVQTFQLYNNYSGSPKSFSASTNLFTTDRIGASSAVLDGYIYIAGGCTSATDCTDATNNTQYASISANGTIGTWANTTDSTLPADRAWGQLEVADSTLYYIGGQDDTSTNEQSTVYYATPGATGDITSWATATNGLPAARTKHSATVWNDRIYVVGGLDSSANETATVYYSPDLSNGGNITSAWSTATSFNVARSGTTAVAYANNLYLFGGHDGTDYLSDSQFTQINSDGTVDSWSYSTSLPTPISQGDGFASNGYMYIIGGREDDTTCDPNTLVAPISANTSITSGNNPTGVGQWYETIERYSGSRYGNTVAYNDGLAYVMGGGCGATLTYTGANRIVQSTIQSQPQVAKYSYMIDTDSDVFPTNWLLNGLDNDIGARWELGYESSTDTANAWGQATNFGPVTLGSVETYTPLDGSGTDTNFARFYYFDINIDSSQAYGYPDDVTRGPTIDDLTLFFTSDPSKRLRHGKTFTGGLKQPLDTPPN